jgi:tetratricopeptide (TPR) repeat protein
MKSDYDNALKYYNQALDNQTEKIEKFVRISNKIGNIYYKKGDYNQALIHYQNTLNKSETSPPDLISSVLMSMAIIYHRQNKYDLARDLYKRVISIRKKLSSNDNLDLAWTYNNLGCLYTDMGDMKRALKYQDKAYDIRRKSLPSTHPDLATSLNNLGRIHQTIAHHSNGNPIELEKALQNYKSALHIRRKSLPIDHPDLAISYYNLALIHIDQQEYEQAYSEIQKALNIQRQKLPVNHPDLERTLKLERQARITLDYRNNLSQYT